MELPYPLKKEQLFEQLVSVTREGFWLIGNDTCTIDLNPSMCEILGRSRDEVIGKSIYEFVDAANRQVFLDEIAKRQKGIRGSYEIALRRPDGTNIPCINNASAIFDDNGEKIGSIGLWTNISELKEKEAELQQAGEESESRVQSATQRLQKSEAQYREHAQLLDLVMNFSPASFTIRDTKGKFIYINRAFAEIMEGLGVNPDNLIGKTLDDFIPSTRRGVVTEDLIAEVVQTKKPILNREYHATRTADHRVFLVSVIPILDGKNRPNSVLTMTLEVTRHKEIEDALKESEAILRLVIDAVPAAIAYLDHECRYRMVNHTLAHRFNMSTQDVIGKTIREVVGDVNDKKIRPHYLEALKGNKQVFEADIIEATGNTRNIEITYIPNIGSDGRNHGFFTLGFDLTERKRLEAQLSQAQKMEAVGQLTGGIAHDFNNLLAVIRLNAELLKEFHDSSNEMVQAILRSAQRGAELTQRLLAFSRRQPLQPRPLDLSALIGDTTDLLRRTLGENIEIETLIDADLWTATADHGQVENALLNLALNSRDAMPAGGKLTIECHNAAIDAAQAVSDPDAITGDFIVIAVTDTGIGMAKEVRLQAFEPFYTTKEIGEGSGLGLSMVYGFAKQSGGRVSIYSEVSKGTTVKLYLPRASDSDQQDKRGQIKKAVPGKHEHILVLEDDADVQTAIVTVLKGLGYHVTSVDTANEGLNLLQKSTFDLVLSDIVLPGGMTGPAFAEAARTTHPELPIIYMSGYPAEAARRSGFLDQNVILLSKPFQIDQLSQAIRSAIDNPYVPEGAQVKPKDRWFGA